MIARIRTIKPGFAADAMLYDIGEALGIEAKAYLAYAGLWGYTDREGRFEWKPRELRPLILPHYPAADLAQIFNAFANGGVVVRYCVAGRLYGWIPRFEVHQSINPRESGSTLPPPPAEAIAILNRNLLRAEMHAFTREEFIAEPETAGLDHSSKFSRPSASAAEAPSPISSNINEIDARARVGHASAPVGDAVIREGKERKGKEREGKERKGEEPQRAGPLAQALEAGADAAIAVSIAIASEASDAGSGSISADEGDRASDGQQGAALAHLSEGSGRAIELVPDTSRNVPALPATQGDRHALTIRDRLALVFSEIAEGTRSKMKKEQLQKLNAEVVFLYWTARFEHPRAILDAKRESRIIARLKENDGDVGELLYALDGAHRDDHIMARGQYQGGNVYDGIETVLRDRGQVEKFSNRMRQFKDGKPHPALEKLASAVRGAADLINPQP